jgi:hypothetical protein
VTDYKFQMEVGSAACSFGEIFGPKVERDFYGLQSQLENTESRIAEYISTVRIIRAAIVRHSVDSLKVMAENTALA